MMSSTTCNKGNITIKLLPIIFIIVIATYGWKAGYLDETSTSRLKMKVALGKTKTLSNHTGNVMRKSTEEEFTSRPVSYSASITMGNKDTCKKQPNLKYFVYIHTAPKYLSRRMNLRDSWVNASLYKDNIRFLFIVGNPMDDKVQHQLENENKKYGDILQGDFIDSYANLTLKGIFALKFIALHCKNTKYVLKADDDVLLNVFEILKYNKPEYGKRFVVCPLWEENTMPILRPPKPCHPFCVPPHEFPGRTAYPQYCAGQFYMTTFNVLESMYRASVRTPSFFVDDVFITGVLTRKARKEKDIKFISMLPHYTLTQEIVRKEYANMSKPINIYITSIQDPKLYHTVWNDLIKRRRKQDNSGFNIY